MHIRFLYIFQPCPLYFRFDESVAGFRLRYIACVHSCHVKSSIFYALKHVAFGTKKNIYCGRLCAYSWMSIFSRHGPSMAILLTCAGQAPLGQSALPCLILSWFFSYVARIIFPATAIAFLLLAKLCVKR